jgi:hypothetical protein
VMAFPLNVIELKIRGRFPWRNQVRHWLSSFRNWAVASTTCFCWSVRVIVAS